MLRDYLRAFWRGVLNNKLATLINVGGLALGFAVFFALSFYVDREFSWDAHWEDAERIYRASGAQETPTGNTPAIMNVGPYVLGTHLLNRHADAFEAYARVLPIQGTVLVGEDEYPNIQRLHVEPALLDILQLETLEGSLAEVLADPRAIAIEERSAQRLFGDRSPLGTTLTFTTQQGNFGAAPTGDNDYVVRAVYRLPGPTTFSMQFMALFEATALPTANPRLDLWQAPPNAFQPPQPGQPPTPPPEQPLNVSHYFKLRDGVDAKAIENDLRAFMDENRYLNNANNSKTRFVFQKLRDTHLTPSLFDTSDNVQRLWVYAAIGVLVLLISGCNFVMLATLRLVDRLREVGIRKSVGGGVKQLMGQYLFDAFFHTLLAGVLAVLFLAFAFPKLQVMLELPLELNLLTARNLALSLLMIVAFTLVSSAYPAWLTSQGKPGPLLRNGGGAVVGSGTGLRKLLVAVQFAIVVVLLLGSAVVRQQIAYTKNRDPGYSMENVVSTRLNNFDLMSRTPALVAEFRKVPGVVAAAVGGPSPGAIFITAPSMLKVIGADGNGREVGIQPINVGPGYWDVVSVRVVAGREFSAADAPPPPVPGAAPAANSSGLQPERRIVLNEAAVRALGFTSPDAALNQLLETTNTMPNGESRRDTLRVIGVVADTQFSSAMLPPVAQYYSFTEQNGYVAVKLAPDADVDAVTQQLGEVFSNVTNGASFVPVDMALMASFPLRREEFEARIITGSTLLAIVIALLGLYGLVAATVVKRVKEIGVRKVMGAERGSIVSLFLWQFSKPIVAANLVAWPFGFWAITQWLQRFPYQLDLAVVVFTGLAASLAALAIAWLTVGLMAARAASVKPVWALRYE